MSRDAEDWVWEHSTSRGTARLVALAIAVYASGPRCSAYAGLTMLMHRTGAKRSAIKTSIDALIKSGEITIVADVFGPRHETTYALPHAVGYTKAGGSESDPGQIPTRVGFEPRGGTDSDPRGVGFEPRGGTDSGPLSRSSRSSKSRERSAQPGDRGHQTASGSAATALSEIPEDWQPSTTALADAAADIRRLGPAGTATATRKFIAYHRSRALRLADPGPAWVTWLSRERLDSRDQPTPTAPAYADQLADLAARMAAEEANEPPVLRSLTGGIDPAASAAGQRALLLAVSDNEQDVSAAAPGLTETELAELRAAAAQDWRLVASALDQLGEPAAVAVYGGPLVAKAQHERTVQRSRTGT